MVAAFDGGFSESELIEFETTEQWAEARHRSIGPADAATVMGYGRNGETPSSLWVQKCGEPSRSLNEQAARMLKIGRLAEPYIAGLLKHDYGWDVQFDPLPSLRRNLQRPYLTCSLDAWMIEDGQHVAIQLGDMTESDERFRYLAVIQQQLAVTGWRKGYFVAMSGFETRKCEVPRYQELIDAMLPDCDKFWRVVQERRPPVPE